MYSNVQGVRGVRSTRFEQWIPYARINRKYRRTKLFRAMFLEKINFRFVGRRFIKIRFDEPSTVDTKRLQRGAWIRSFAYDRKYCFSIGKYLAYRRERYTNAGERRARFIDDSRDHRSGNFREETKELRSRGSDSFSVVSRLIVAGHSV